MRIVNDNLNRYVRSQAQNTLGIGKPVPRFEISQRIELNHFNNMWKSALALDLGDIRTSYNLKTTVIAPDMLKRLSLLVEQYHHHFAIWDSHAYIVQSPFKKSVLNKIFNYKKVKGHSVIVMQSDIARKEILVAKGKGEVFTVLTRDVNPSHDMVEEHYSLIPLCNYLNERVIDRNNFPDTDLSIFINRLWSFEKVISPFWFKEECDFKLSTDVPFKKFGEFTREELKLFLRHLRKNGELNSFKRERTVLLDTKEDTQGLDKEKFDRMLAKALSNSPLKKYQSSPNDTLFNLVKDVESYYDLIVQNALEYFADEHKQTIIEHKDDFEFLKKFLPFPLKLTYDEWESHCEQFRFVLQFERDIELKINLS